MEGLKCELGEDFQLDGKKLTDPFEYLVLS